MELSRFLYQSVAFVSSYATRCAVELEISDRIKAYGSPMPLHELARSISVPPEKELMLDQLMQLLVHQGVYAKSEGGNYMLTPVSELMLTEGAANMGSYVRFLTAALADHCSFMSKWFKDASTGTVFQMAHDGKLGWDIFKENPEIGNLFNEAMAGRSKEMAKDLVASYPEIFNGGVNHLLDVGGGTGMTVKIIADAFPDLKCTVFDLPHVVEKALKCDSFNAVGGDMFDKIPPADAILLKDVLHNWPDMDCVRILENCKEAIKSTRIDGKVIVVNMILDEEMGDAKATETNLLYSLLMSTIGSKERTKKEWHDLILKAGYSSYKIYPTRMCFYSVIELYP